MARIVKCVKLGQELEGLDYPPLKGDIGRRIFAQVSKQAWKLWLNHSTMVINEYRLNPSEPQAQKILLDQVEKFFFGGGVEAPPDYVAPSKDSGHHHEH